MSDVDFEAEGELAENCAPFDPTAEKTKEHRLTCEAAAKCKDPTVKKELLEMAKRVRLSIKGVVSEANVTALPGRKAERGPFAKD